MKSIDLLFAFSFNNKLVVTSEILDFKESAELTSVILAFVFILFENREVSFAASKIKSNAACVLALIVFSASVVLLTLSKANAVFKAAILATPVPPLSIGMMPFIFPASTLLANCA